MRHQGERGRQLSSLLSQDRLSDLQQQSDPQRRQEDDIRFICILSCAWKGTPPLEKQVRVH